ncbi:MAG: hypothetical protein HQL51_01625 [Magnetococcales bacterium]|nr:hypothetical protein [Magnetococcales bacterium]
MLGMGLTALVFVGMGLHTPFNNFGEWLSYPFGIWLGVTLVFSFIVLPILSAFAVPLNGLLRFLSDQRG